MTDETKGTGFDALLADYACGRAPEPVRVLIESHLELSPANRAWVRALEAFGGAELEAVKPVPIADRGAMLARIMAEKGERPAPAGPQHPQGRDALLPGPLRRYLGMPLDRVPWRRRLPSVREYRIPNPEGLDVGLFWFKAGGAIPGHTHEGYELVLVLEGSYTDETGRYARGDIQWADDTIDHRPIADPGADCLCFAVADAPLRLTGFWGRLLNVLLPGMNKRLPAGP